MRRTRICNCDLRTKLVGDGCEACNPALALDYADETIADLRAEIERLRREMTLILPVLESLERDESAWVSHTMGTGVATLNGYRRALEQQQ